MEVLKQNAIRLARHHRKCCEGAECNISLWLIAELLMKAGIELTDDEKKEFI